MPPAAPDPGDPLIVLLTDGPGNSAYWEHVWLARALGVPLVTPADLMARGDRLLLRGTARPVDVVYRRTDEDRANTDARAACCCRAMRRGTLGVINAFGTGVADDKLAQAYVEDMIRFYLGEEPCLRSVPTYDLARPTRPQGGARPLRGARRQAARRQRRARRGDLPAREARGRRGWPAAP